jgi:hypothetical protein
MADNPYASGFAQLGTLRLLYYSHADPASQDRRPMFIQKPLLHQPPLSQDESPEDHGQWFE